MNREMLLGNLPEAWEELATMQLYVVFFLAICFFLLQNFLLAIIVEGPRNPITCTVAYSSQDSRDWLVNSSPFCQKSWRARSLFLPFAENRSRYHRRGRAHRSREKDWQSIAKQPASASHMLRIVPHTVPRVGRSYEHFPAWI